MIKYHICGAKLRVRSEWNGRIYFLVQIDEEGKDVGWDCPGCGEHVFRDEVLDEPPAVCPTCGRPFMGLAADGEGD